jgi:hypothetical protein
MLSSRKVATQSIPVFDTQQLRTIFPNMKRLIQGLFLLSATAFVQPDSARANSKIELPPPLDEETFLIERYWSWLKAEVDAPSDLPWPRIDIEPLPRTVRMAFIFPTAEAPWRQTRIVISPRSVDRAAGSERLSVVGELAHEIVHYVLILAENGWDFEADIMRNDVHHHCDHEFMRLTRQIANFIWVTYHSNDAIRSVDHMVQLACWRDGHGIGGVTGR